MSSLAGFVVVVSSLLSQAAAQPPGAAQMKEFGDMMVGKWHGESVVDFDLPGVCKKGDKVATERTTEWVLNGTALLSNIKYEINGKVTSESVSLAGWDLSRNGIRTRGFGTLGGTVSGMWKKQGSTWRHRGQGVIPGDVTHSSVTSITVENADTLVSQATQRVLNEKELPDIKTTFKRVK